MGQSRCLITFIKNVELGKCKTRIAQSVGQSQANRIYEDLLDITRDVCSRVNADRYVFYSDTIVEDDLWSTSSFYQRLQNDGNLGDRITSAFDELSPRYDKVLIVGSDCPYINTSLVESAFDLLDNADLVLGPAQDGGYYLFATNSYHPSLFQNIQWSTSTVLMDTIRAAESLGLSISQLDTLSDVDYYEDWQTYLKYKEEKSTLVKKA